MVRGPCPALPRCPTHLSRLLRDTPSPSKTCFPTTDSTFKSGAHSSNQEIRHLISRNTIVSRILPLPPPQPRWDQAFKTGVSPEFGWGWRARSNQDLPWVPSPSVPFGGVLGFLISLSVVLGKPLVGFCWFVLNSVTIKEKRRGLRVISLRLMELVAGEGGVCGKSSGSGIASVL